MYQVLARKWRPKTFSEIVGQEHILRALTNALEQQRLHHAYLFTGTRGVGKTTIARILAKCFNCKVGVTAVPCCNCDSCNEIDTGRFIDLIEVDAASRTKVEDTRDLLDNVQYLPVAGRYKIYLIDEVHMLSNHSFNALLKTLEEPPAHVKFLLATTDPQKLPATILSRCLQFNLKKLSPDYIQAQLGKILNQEQITFEDKALLRLAIAADGSVRDALSLLDQAIAYGGGSVKAADVCTMLGSIENTYIFQLLEGLANKDANYILNTITELATFAADFSGVLDELLNFLHYLAIAQLAPNASSSILENSEQIQKFATVFTTEEIQLYYQIALIGKRDLSLAPIPKSGFEMVMLRMLAFRPQAVNVNLAIAPVQTSFQSMTPTMDPSSLVVREQVRNKVESQTEISMPSPATEASKKIVVATTPTQNSIHNSSDNNNVINDIIIQLKLSGPTAALLKNCMVAKINENSADLVVMQAQAPLLNKNARERVNAAFSEFFGKSMRVEIAVGSSGMDINTPAKAEQQKLTQQQEEMMQVLAGDPKVQKIINVFGAKILPETVKSINN